MDYEHAKPMPLAYPNWSIVPDVITNNYVPFHARRVLRYPGIKEDVYINNFKPNSRIYKSLDILVDEQNILITVRPPATEAHYHNPQSEILFEEMLDYLLTLNNLVLIVLPRNDKQKGQIESLRAEAIKNKKIVMPKNAVDGINLIWHSDLVISGGGTMNREAAALGVSVYSIFRGKIGAVDRYLAAQGRLILIENVGEIKTKIKIEKREKKEMDQTSDKPALQSIVNHIIKIYDII
jgi:predicted glycosyltransferase